VAINKNKINDNALKYIQKGQVKKAIREYEKILADDPGDVRTLLKKGDLLVRVGEKDQAVETYLAVASTYSQQGFHLKAVAVFKQILKIDDKRIDVNLHLAEEYQNLGIVGDAMSHLRIVAGHYEQQNMVRESLDILRRIVDLDPENIASRIKLAELYSREEMVREAVEEFSRAAEDLKAANRIEDYVKVAERLIYHDNSNFPLIKELANIYLQRGDTKRALGKLQICFKADPRDLEVLRMLAMAFQELGQLSKTVSVFKEMAKIYEEQGALDEMQQVYQRILEIRPDDPEANQALSGAAQPAAPAEAELVDAEPVLEQELGGHTMPTASIPSPPPEPEMLEMEADESEAMDQPTMEQSISDFDQEVMDEDLPRIEDDMLVEDSVEIESPELPADQEVTIGETRTVDELAVDRHPAGEGEDTRETISRLLTETEVYIKYGLQNKAFDHLSKIFQLDPNNIEAHEKLKDIYIAADQLDHAAQELLTLVHLNNHVGRVDEARAHLRSLLTMFPDHPEGLALAGRLGEVVPQAAAEATVPGGQEVPQAGGEAFMPAEPVQAEELVPGDAMDAVDDMAIDVETDDLMDEEEEEAPTMIADRAALDAELGKVAEQGPEEGQAMPFDQEISDLDYDAGEETVEASVLNTGVYDESNDPQAMFEAGEAQDELGEPEILELREESRPATEQQVPDELETPFVQTGEEELIEFTGEEDFFELEQKAQELREQQQGAGQVPEYAQEEPGLAAAEEEPVELEMVDDVELIDEEEIDGGQEQRDEFDSGEASTQMHAGLPADEQLAAPEPPELSAAAVDIAAQADDEPVSESDFEGEARTEMELAPGPQEAAGQQAAADEVPPVAEPEAAEEGMDEELEDSLEEVDFFMQQNLLDEAAEELAKLKDAYPSNAEVDERLAKIERLQQGEAPLEPEVEEEIEGPFDLAAEIEREVGDEASAVPLDEDFQYSFDDVFSEFKKGVEKVVDKEDSATHFDLGIAYKEMGLIDDAISEFDIAAQDDGKSSSALNMIGLCFLEKGQYSEAINRFKDALHGPGISEREATGVFYEMGRAYELLEDPKEALFYYRKVYKRDANFRDAADKIENLKSHEGADDKKDKKGEKEENKKTANSKSNISYM